MHFENYLRIPEEFVITEWDGGMKEQQKYGTKAFIPSGEMFVEQPVFRQCHLQRAVLK